MTCHRFIEADASADTIGHSNLMYSCVFVIFSIAV